MFIQLIKLLSGQSRILFGLSIASSLISGLMTLGAFVLLFSSLHAEQEVPGTWWIFAAVAAAALATRGLAHLLLGHISRKSVMEMRIRLAHGITAAPLIALERIGDARLTGAFSNEITTVAAALPHLVRFFANTGFVIACLIFLGWLSPTGLGLIMIIIAVGLLGSYLLRREGLKHLRVSRQRWDELLQTFRILVGGAKELKLDPERRTRVLDAYEVNARSLRDSTRNQFTFFSSASGGIQLLLFLALGFMVISSDLRSTADRQLLIGYSILLIYMIGPLRSINGALHALNEAEVVLARLQELGIRLDAFQPPPARRKSLAATDGARDIADRWRRLELVDVTHTYRVDRGTEEFALGPISLSFARGEVVFIIGGNGSGKTTLAKLLTGLYLPRTGEIRLDGRAIGPAGREWYRQQFSAIFSDFFLFEELVDTGDPLLEQSATALLQRLRLGDKVQIRNRALSTTALSLGERKRLALVLACLQDRPICVFDEWSAEQEPVFKDVFYLEILNELRARGKLVVVISHDDRYFEVADKIVVLERATPPVVRDMTARSAAAIVPASGPSTSPAHADQNVAG